MTNMRAKVKVYDVQKYDGSENLIFTAVCAKEFGSDGSDENNTYSKWTPSAEFKMSITNPKLFNQFEVGKEYYVDFTPVQKD